jgi:hypothetical protein
MDFIYAQSTTITYTSGTPTPTPYRNDIDIEDNVAMVQLEMVVNMTVGSTAITYSTAISPTNRLLALLDEIEFSVEGAISKLSGSGEVMRYLSEMQQKLFPTRVDTAPTGTAVTTTDYTAILYVPVQVPKTVGKLFYTIRSALNSAMGVPATGTVYGVNTVTYYISFLYGDFDTQLFTYYFDQTINGLEDVKLSKISGNLVGFVVDGYNNDAETITALRFKHEKIDIINSARLSALYEYTRISTYGKIIRSSTNYSNVIVADIKQIHGGSIPVNSTTMFKITTSSSTTLRFCIIYEEFISKGSTSTEIKLKGTTKEMQDVKNAPSTPTQQAKKPSTGLAPVPW